MGLVWAVRRSLRLLTLLTLMASALCSGQSLATQDNAAPPISLSGWDAAPPVTLAGSVSHQPPPVLAASGVFEGESAVTVASAISTVDTAFRPVSSSTAAIAVAPVVVAPRPHVFSPLAERAPPAA